MLRLRPFGVCSFALTVLLILAYSNNVVLHAQDTKPGVEEPQYVGHFSALGADGKLVALEQQKLNIETKSHNHFVSNSVSTEQTVPNPASPVRLGPSVHFVVRVMSGSESIDPATYLVLKPFVVQKDKRSLPMVSAKAGIFQGVKSQSAADTAVAVTFKKYGMNSLEIVPSQSLPAGEYLLIANGGASVFCFGVDIK
jgi:hypothetical protein